MSINFSTEAKDFIKNNNIKYLFLDVDTIEEGCTAIYNPNLKIVSNKINSEQVIENIETEDIQLFISKDFNSLFGIQKQFEVDLVGFFEKVLTITNIEAKTKNICKV
ncbi:MAG: hypothetical protein ACQERB_13890 [Promethearchaeati archaeon]